MLLNRVHIELEIDCGKDRYSFDPIHGRARHNREDSFVYGKPCSVGDYVRVSAIESKDTISFERSRDGKIWEDFGVAFEANFTNLFWKTAYFMVNASKFQAFQCSIADLQYTLL